VVVVLVAVLVLVATRCDDGKMQVTVCLEPKNVVVYY